MMATPRIPRWALVTALLILLAGGAWWLYATGTDWRSLVVENRRESIAIFSLCMVILPLLGFPISAFYVFAGLTFTIGEALLAGGVGLLANMALGYLLARTVWREPLRRKFIERWPKLFELDRKTSTQVTILVRAVPGIPFTLQNYLLGVLAVPFGAYLALSWGIQMLFLCGVVLTTQGAMNKDGMLALWGGVLVLAVLVGARLVYRSWNKTK